MPPAHRLSVINGTLIVPAGWQSVSRQDYYPDDGFTAVRFDGSPTELDADAFFNCTQLQRLDLPESVQHIGEHAFHCCPALKYITGPGVLDLDGSPIAQDDTPIPMVLPLVDIAEATNTALRRSLALGYLCEPRRYAGQLAANYARYARTQRIALLAAADVLGLPQPAAYYAARGYPTSVSAVGTADNIGSKARVEMLKQAVMTQSAQELRQTLAAMKPVEFAPHIVAMAARFRGLAHVQALVDAGYTLAYDVTSPLLDKYGFTTPHPQPFSAPEFACALVSFMNLQPKYIPGLEALHLLPQYTRDNGSVLTMRPAQERVEILQYLLTLPNCGGVRTDRLLYFVILDGDRDITRCLLAHGAQLSRRRAQEMACQRGASPHYLYRLALTMPPADVRDWILHTLVDCMQPLGMKPHISQTMLEYNPEYYFTGDRFAYIAAHADLSGAPQQRCIEMLIDHENTSGLAAAEKLGWLKQPRKRDALIAYADTTGSRASLAWLMDYKDRTADLIAEAAREEARINRMLNEKPDSPSAMRRVWRYERMEDGCIRLLSYKGEDTYIVVPDHIGKDRVTALGPGVFSPWQRRISAEQYKLRKHIDTIVIPEGVTSIDHSLCSGCEWLESITLPESLYEIGDGAFAECLCLRSLRIPQGVVHIGTGILSMSYRTGVSITGKPGTMAQVYAHRYRIRFVAE